MANPLGNFLRAHGLWPKRVTDCEAPAPSPTPAPAPEPTPEPEPTRMVAGPRARALIQKWEGIEDGDPSTVELDPYLCPAGYWTIGWGHVVRDEKGRMLYGRRNKQKAYDMYPRGITMAEAEKLLREDLVIYEDAVHRYAVTPETTVGQFGAMVSLCFNIGTGNFSKSSVARHHRGGRHELAANSFLLWNKATLNGKLTVLRGLTRRRENERAFYLRHTP